MKSLLIAFLSFIALNSFAQNANIPLEKTFEIHSKNANENLGKYYAAASQRNINDVCDLDRYRFYNERRTIAFLGSDAYIVLYSAKELNEKYGKPVSSYTIQKGQSYPEITFAVNLDGKGLKPQFK